MTSEREESTRNELAVSERWWIVITRGGNVYPLTNPDEAARWEGKAAEIIGPLVPAPGSPGGAVEVTDEMIERGARSLCELGMPTLNGKIATWDANADGLRHTAAAVLRAALEVTDDQ